MVYFTVFAAVVTAAELAKPGAFSASSAMWQAGMLGALLATILLALVPERLFASGVAPRTRIEPANIRRLELLASFSAGSSVVLLLFSSSWFFATVSGFFVALLLSRHLRNQAALD